jgi:putative phage-type endonuclease
MTATLAPILVLPGDADRGVWLARRREGVGASDVAAILGISPYQGPLHVWLDKTGQLDWDGNAATKWGSRFEDDVLDEFVEGHPELIVTPKPGMFADPSEPWRTASLDAEALGEDGLEVVEVKTGQLRRSQDQWGEPGTDEIPLHYLTQVTWSCEVRQAARWRLAFLPLDELEDYREYAGEFSPTLGAQLRDRVAPWRQTHLIGGVEPDADGLADTTDILGLLAATRIKPVTGEIDRRALLWQTGAITNHLAVNEFTAAKDEYINLLRQAMLTAGVEEGQVDGVTVATWKPNRSGKRVFRVKGI